MLKPKAHFDSALEISPQWLKEQGLKAVLLDLDNTLVPYKTYGECPPALRQWLDALHASGIRTMLVSNGSAQRVRYWSQKLGIPGFGPAGKPWFGFRRALAKLQMSPNDVAVVGDQLFTDVLGGNWIGAYTILVPPISQTELSYTRLVRQLERWILSNPSMRPDKPGSNEDSDPQQIQITPTIEKK